MFSKGTASAHDGFIFMQEYDWIKSHAKHPEPSTPSNIFEAYRQGYKQGLEGNVPAEQESFGEEMQDVVQSLGAMRYEVQRLQMQRKVLQTQIYDDTLKSRVAHKAHNLLFKALDYSEVPQNERYNDWRIKYDDEFAQAYYSSLPTFVPAHVSRCCNFCGDMLLRSGRSSDHSVSVRLAEFIEIAKACSICQLILRASVHTVDEQSILRLSCSSTSIRSVPQGQRLMRFGAIAGFQGKSAHKMPIGQPILQDSDRKARFHLLRAWLRRCDETHRCRKYNVAPQSFPTRVLDVGGLEDLNSAPGWVRIINATERKNDTYIAVSHCWGQLTDAQKHTFCTSVHNLSERHHGFHVSELPRTFQDAVKVARAVGVRYLWIDSICIIQYGDDQQDWKREAVRMKDVYSGAYFTIAATAATDSNSGFLDRNEFTEYTSVDSQHGKFFISTDVDDFDRDVVQASLNSRAWVFQETVLARRTVHFSPTQMYWECGAGVSCENQTMLTCLPTDRFFMMDPMFPARILQHLEANTVKAFEYCLIPVIEEYSKRQLTFAKDRPIAIAGLEERIMEAFNSESKFGILEKHLHYSLLWKPTGHKVASVEHTGLIPSWSWMSYPGAVDFQRGLQWLVSNTWQNKSTMEAAKGWLKASYNENGLDVNTNVTFHKHFANELSADLATITGCTLYQRHPEYIPGLVPGMDYVLQRMNGQTTGFVAFDTQNPSVVNGQLCIVVARIRGKYFVGIDENFYACVLVVPAFENCTYRRIGMGFVQTDCVRKLQNNIRII